MRILIELPTWLGDAVMTTPAIQNLEFFFVDCEITLIGSDISIEALKHNPKVINTYSFKKNYISLFKIIKSLNEFDVFISFRSSNRSKLLKFFVRSSQKYQFDKKKYNKGHQVEKYNNFVNESLDFNSIPNRLIIHTQNKNKIQQSKIAGINPGASYGNAKRWHPKKFAAVATNLASQYDIIIFGGPEEQEIATDIEKYLIKNGVQNYQNLAGKTSINEFIEKIASLDLFITGDSGPMHLASALQVPTISIFGPTNDKETSQWKNEKSIVVKKNLDCQPCMKRECPLIHHNCMRLINAEEVLIAVKAIN
jgi:heptosyltransferase II